MRKIASTLTVILLLALYTVCCCGAEDVFKIEYNADESSLAFEGMFPENVGFVIISVVASDINLTSTVPEKNIAVKVVKTDESGRFEGKIKFNNEFSSNVYTARATCGAQEYEKSFTHINEDEAIEVLNNLQSVEMDDFKKIIGDNLVALGMTGKDADEAYPRIVEYLFHQKPQSGYTINLFVNAKTRIESIISAEKSGEWENILNEASESFGINPEADYVPLPEDAKKYVIESVKSFDYNNINFSSEYRKVIIIADIRYCENYTDLSEKFKKYASEIDADMSYYSKINSDYYKSRVYSLMYAESISKWSDIKAAFEKSARSAYDEYKIANDNSKGSGGGGGGGKGFVSPPKAMQQQSIEKQNAYNDTLMHWANAAITELAEKGIVSGYQDGSFKPDKSVSRAEFVKLITQAFSITGEACEHFKDVPADSWFAPYVSAAYQNGIVEGDNGLFSPDALITREQAATIIARTMKLNSGGNMLTYTDSDEISDYARGAVAVLTKHAIVNGVDGKFMPAKSATRAEAVQMICNALKEAAQ